MADITITAANVLSSGQKASGVAGATITAGDVLILNGSNALVLASDDSAVNSDIVGIALNDAASGQPCQYHTGGLIDLGATLDIGKVYVLSTSGGIAPVDDIAGTEYVTVIGVATAADSLLATYCRSGVAAASAVA